MKQNDGMTPQDHNDLRTLSELAGSLEPRPDFTTRLEAGLKMHHRTPPTPRKPPVILRYAGWAVALLALAFFLNWLIGSLAPERVPAAGPDSTTDAVAPAPTPTMQPDASVEGISQAWRGTDLSMRASLLPSGPSEAFVFQTQPDTPGTLESARALAARMGIQGRAYLLPVNTPGFLITDGKQRLYYTSDNSYTYHPDYPAFLSSAQVFPVADAEAQIAAFMSAHGLDFPYRVQPSEFFTGYYALPLAEDGVGFRFEHFQYSGLLFRFNAEGITAVEAKLLSRQPVGTYAIRSAQEALDWLLASENGSVGILEGMNSGISAFESWYRQYPDDVSVTLYTQPPFGFASADGSGLLVTLEGYPLLGAGQIPEGFSSPNMIRATGKFTRQNGIRYFQVDSWELLQSPQDGLQGTLQEQNGQIVLITIDGETLSIPDAPSGLPLPMENVYVLGYRDGSVLQWNSIDTRMTSGGGGGGGGGLGLYSLNLTGTPMPLPTPEPVTTQPSGSGIPYMVQAGDTFASIAQTYGLTPEELLQHNGITDPSTLFIGQTLMVPYQERSDGWQGTLMFTIYRSPDGSERHQYSFLVDGGGYYQLEGDLEDLSAYINRPVKIWGPIHEDDPVEGYVITVERYEIPYPDLNFSIRRGTLANQTLEGEVLTIFSETDGRAFVVLMPDGSLNSYPADPGVAEVLVEALEIPGETYMGYPALRVHSSALAVNPKTNAPTELTVTADQPQVVDEGPTEVVEVPSMTIESVQLIYYTRDTTFNPTAAEAPAYIQPMWLFTGHYSNGDEFEILIQALRDEYLSPVIETIEPPG